MPCSQFVNSINIGGKQLVELAQEFFAIRITHAALSKQLPLPVRVSL